MEDEKYSQYTYKPEEKEIMEILRAFESEIQLKMQETKSEVEKIIYYETFVINEMDFRNVFITTEKDVDGNITYHLYTGDSSNEIISIGKDGQVKIKEELQYIFEYIDIEDILEENKEKIVGTSQRATVEEEKEFFKENEKQESQEETEQINKEIAETGEDLELVNYRKIKDPHLKERMPEIFEDSEENGYAYSNKLHKPVLISTINGEKKINEKVKEAKMTWKTMISIGEDGNSIERTVPDYIMETENPEQEIAIMIDPNYGTIDLETIQVLPCQERIANKLRMQGETQNKQTNLQTEQFFRNSGEEHELAHQVQTIEKNKIENGEKTQTEITEETLVPKTEITWGELIEATGKSLIELIQLYNEENTEERRQIFEEMPEAIEEAHEYNIPIVFLSTLLIESQKDKVSIKEFMSKFNSAEGSTLEEKIDDAHDKIAEDYRGKSL